MPGLPPDETCIASWPKPNCQKFDPPRLRRGQIVKASEDYEITHPQCPLERAARAGA